MLHNPVTTVTKKQTSKAGVYDIASRHNAIPPSATAICDNVTKAPTSSTYSLRSGPAVRQHQQQQQQQQHSTRQQCKNMQQVHHPKRHCAQPQNVQPITAMAHDRRTSARGGGPGTRNPSEYPVGIRANSALLRTFQSLPEEEAPNNSTRTLRRKPNRDCAIDVVTKTDPTSCIGGFHTTTTTTTTPVVSEKRVNFDEFDGTPIAIDMFDKRPRTRSATKTTPQSSPVVKLTSQPSPPTPPSRVFRGGLDESVLRAVDVTVLGFRTEVATTQPPPPPSHQQHHHDHHQRQRRHKKKNSKQATPPPVTPRRKTGQTPNRVPGLQKHSQGVKSPPPSNIPKHPFGKTRIHAVVNDPAAAAVNSVVVAATPRHPENAPVLMMIIFIYVYI